MTLLYESKNQNAYNNTMLLKTNQKGFYGFRWRGDSLKWGYNVSDCGTIKDIERGLKDLIFVCNEFINKWKKENESHYKILIDQNEKEIAIYNELLEFLKKI